MRAGLDANGRPPAWLHELTEKHDPDDATWIAYGIENRAARFVNGTDPIPFSPWRSVDNSHHGFFIESFARTRALVGTPRRALAMADANLILPAAAKTFACALDARISETETPHLYLLLRRTLADESRVVCGVH